MYELPRKNIYQSLNHHIKTGIIGIYSSSPKRWTHPRHYLQEGEGEGIWGGYAVCTTFLNSFFECDTDIFCDLAPLDATQDAIIN